MATVSRALGLPLALLLGGLLVSAAARPAAANHDHECQSDLDCDDGNPCTEEVCNVALETCSYSDLDVGCDDGNPCTQGDVCALGSCVGGDVVPGCDACAGLALLPPQGGTFLGSAAGSTPLAPSCGGDPGSPERLYAWTASASGIANFDTCDERTEIDTLLAISSGACGDGSELACVDDAGCGAGGRGARVELEVVEGETYTILVGAAGAVGGVFALDVRPPSECGNGVLEPGEQCDGAEAADCATGSCAGLVSGEGEPCTCIPPAGGLPDLTPEISNPLVQLDRSVAPGDVAEGCAVADHGIDRVSFTSRIWNLGTAHLAFGPHGCPDCRDQPGALCDNPAFVCSPPGGHGHPHLEHFTRYELLDADGRVVASTRKQSFCLLDSTCMEGAPSQRFRCTSPGISVGCADIYTRATGCQYVDATGVPGGDYVLRMIVDPFDLIPELDETNNVALAPISLPDRPPPCDLPPDADGDGRADLCECGDADSDGFVDTSDARAIQRCATGQAPCGSLCDANGDGLCTSTDARLVMRFAVGLLSKDDLRCTANP